MFQRLRLLGGFGRNRVNSWVGNHRRPSDRDCVPDDQSHSSGAQFPGRGAPISCAIANRTSAVYRHPDWRLHFASHLRAILARPRVDTPWRCPGGVSGADLQATDRATASLGSSLCHKAKLEGAPIRLFGYCPPRLLSFGLPRFHRASRRTNRSAVATNWTDPTTS